MLNVTKEPLLVIGTDFHPQHTEVTPPQSEYLMGIAKPTSVGLMSGAPRSTEVTLMLPLAYLLKPRLV
jgi:hypothetical protein